MSEKKKRNIIIGSLCAVVLLMAVGYAAFQTVLNINGTSNISSNWNVKITDVTSKNIVGSASNNGNPTFTDTSATFKTNLVSPGDSLEYDITVTNAGNLNAKLDKITLSDTNNPAIKFTSSGLTEGDIIAAGSTGTVTVKVEFLASVTSDPGSKSSSLTVTLDYSQATSSTPSGESAADMLIKTAVTSGDGLYKDTYEEGRYVYKGDNPSNYITYNGEEWRILAVYNDGTLKIRKNASIGTIAWDKTDLNNWARPSTLNTYLNNDYYNTLSVDAQRQIQSHDFGIGSFVEVPEGPEEDELLKQITRKIVYSSENQEMWNGKIGLMSISEYLNGGSNQTLCENLFDYFENMEVCAASNYLTKGAGEHWLITKYIYSLGDETTYVMVGSNGGYMNVDNHAKEEKNDVYPTLHLKSDITLSGEGTKLNPYMIA